MIEQVKDQIAELKQYISKIAASADDFNNIKKQIVGQGKTITLIDDALKGISARLDELGKDLEQEQQVPIDEGPLKTKIETQGKSIAQIKKDLKELVSNVEGLTERLKVLFISESEQEEGLRQSKAILDSLLQRIQSVHQATEFMTTQVNVLNTEQQELKAKLASMEIRLVDSSEVRGLRRWLVVLSVLLALVLVFEGYRILRVILKMF